ncbi:MAG: glycosyltransferase family 4 protein [Victivallales bacterium]
MKIAHLIAQFYPYLGGAEICVHNVCESLSKSGHGATVICTTPPSDKKPDVNYEIIHIHPKTCGLLRKAPFIGKFYLEYELSRLQRKHKFDLWQVTMGYPLGIYAVDFFRKNKIPCVLRCCGEDIQKYPEIGYGYRLDKKADSLVKEKYPLFDGFVALTPSVMEEYLALGIPEDKIRIIPNGVNTAKFAEIRMRSDKTAVRRKYGLSENKLLILTVGRYHPKKGFDEIPEIAEVLTDKNITFDWAVAGKNCGQIAAKFPDCLKNGVKTVESLAKSGGEVFSLPSAELIELYCAADIFVLPTLIETFGMVLVEAMAAGLPIVTTDAPGVRDVISDGVNGLKSPVGDPNAIAGLIAQIIRDKALSCKLSENSIRHSREFYDWEIVCEQYLDLYQDVVAPRRENWTLAGQMRENKVKPCAG